jgi:hydrogenase nickel incorporation protein HypA/HybF
LHEVTILESILEVAEDKARGENAPSITVIKIRRSEFAAIARQALEFAFEVARLGIPAEHARLEIEVVPLVLHCVVWEAGTQPPTPMSLICRRCGFPLRILYGKNLQIEYIEMDECCPESMVVA